MTVLVAAASKHGATDEIASRIGATLAEHGVAAEAKKLEDVTDLAAYEACVIGSAVYLGKWLKPATRFVEAHAGDLAERPTWLFSSGPIVGDPPRPEPEDSRHGDALAERVHAREHKLFAGKLDRSTLGLAEKAAVRAAHAQDGDHRDWQAIDAWATGIARKLGGAQGAKRGG